MHWRFTRRKDYLRGEHFDLIGGTSVEGLLAIMFGLLGMSCDEATDAYIQMGQWVLVCREGKTGVLTIRQDASLRDEFSADFMRLLEGRSAEMRVESSALEETSL